MRWSIAAVSLSAAALVACSESQSPTDAVPTSSLADVIVAPTGQGIPNRYIIVFKQNVTGVAAEAQSLVGASHGEIHFIYTSAIKGFAADLSSQAVQALRSDPWVAWIEQDQRISLDATQTPTPNWGLDRIDQRNLPLNNTYNYNRTGAGTHFYGIDTGINLTHNDLAGRVGNGFDAINSGGNASDCNGHGTHTATTAAGTIYGVAKSATVHPVRVLNCNGSGSVSGVVAGVDWVTNHHQSPAVANMSLGGSPSTSLDQAVAGSVASGVVYSVSAGNSNANACNTSPARVSSALTVAASNKQDQRASFSNFGACVDIFAPGVGITAGWIGGNNATRTINGTSMSAPHVAGVALQYREANPGATPAQVASAIITNATAGKITNPGNGSPNRLLFMGFIGGGGNQAPVAKFTATCNANHSCTFDASSSTDDVGIVAYEWKRGSGAIIGNTKVITFTFATGGSKTIILTVTDGGGLTGTITKTINVP